MGLYRSDTLFGGLIFEGAYFRGGLYTGVKIVQESIFPQFEKRIVTKLTTDIYPTYLCRWEGAPLHSTPTGQG